MSSFKAIATALTLAALTSGLVAAPSRGNSTRGKAIDLLSEGQTLENQGNREGAYQKYYESAQLAPSPSAYYHLGRVARLSGQKDMARQYLNQALSLNPGFELAKVELVQLNDGSGKADKVVNAVAGEMSGEVAPGTAASYNAPMNVDKLRKEVVTMKSLAPPQFAGASAADQVGSISSADSHVASAGNDGGAGKLAVSTAAQPATPQDIILEGESKDANSDVSDILSPTLESSQQGEASLPSLASASGTTDADGGPSRDAINEAAFGEESKKDPGSKGYNQATKVALGTFAFHRERADDYRKANRWKDAAVEYKHALELSPDDAETRSLLAEMYGRIGASDRAQTQFEKAKAQAPNDDSIYYKQGNAYFDEQKYDLAIGSYRQALDINPSNKFALNNMGVAYMEKKDYTMAAEKFKAVLALDPAYEMAVLNLGIIYDEHIVDKQQALKYYDQYLALKGPRSTEVRRWADVIRAKSS